MLPEILISPESELSTPNSRSINVVLPAPEDPTIEISSPFFIFNETPETAGVIFVGYVFETLIIEISGLKPKCSKSIEVFICLHFL